MKLVLNTFFFLLSFLSNSQIPLYEYRDIQKSLKITEKLSTDRSVVIVHVPDETNGLRRVGDWQKTAFTAHKAFVIMGIDVVMYINHYDLLASDNSKSAYASLFNQRKIKNIIFLTEKESGYELLIVPFNESPSFINNGISLFYMEKATLNEVLLQTGREVKRADYEVENFLIPAKPNFVSGISVVEKSLLKNYPGILRRSTLSVERFAKLEVPASASSETARKISTYNKEIDLKNIELDSLIKQYPYKCELIDPLSDEDLLRQRRQFVLRSISGQAKTLREMLDYQVDPSETDFVSVIPVMPDQTRAKPIPKNAFVHKFYVRQNISKNIHVGEWDADTSWQEALTNMIGNLIQEHNVDR